MQKYLKRVLRKNKLKEARETLQRWCKKNWITELVTNSSLLKLQQFTCKKPESLAIKEMKLLA